MRTPSLPPATSSHAGGLSLAGVRLGEQLLACPSAGGLFLLSLDARAELSPAELAQDAGPLVRRLVSLGFRLDLNHAGAIAGLLWTAWGQGMALGPDGWQTPSSWREARRREREGLAPAFGGLPSWALPAWMREALAMPPLQGTEAGQEACAW